MNDNPYGGPVVPLAAVCYGSPVIDVRGAFVGTVESVSTGDPDAVAELCEPIQGEDRLRRIGFVRVHRCGPGECDLLVTSAHIACVGDDHVRLSITTDDAIAAQKPTASPR